MSETLSQNELDQILGALSGDSPPSAATDAPAEAGRVHPYDFSHPDLLSREQVRAIRTLHEGYAQALAKKLSTEFLSNVSASVISVDHLTYGEFLVLLPTPTVLSVIEVEELSGNVAIELNPNLAFTFIDRTLGGVGAPLPKVRALTGIEQGLTATVLGTFCQELSMIWAPFEKLSFRLHSLEGNPELARVIDPAEMVVLISFEIKMNDITGTMNLCLPFVVMETAFQRLSQGVLQASAKGPPPEIVRGALEESVRTSALSIEVDLGTADLSLRDILGLEVGDVVRVTPASAWGAAARIAGAPDIAGVPGRHKGSRAIEVMETVPAGSADAPEPVAETKEKNA